MNEFLGQFELPGHLYERIRVILSHSAPHSGQYILYWMHHAVRAHDNPALDTAILVARQKKLPLLVYQGLGGNHAFNSDRHHTFILQGAKDVQKSLRDRGIRYAFHLAENPFEKSPLLDLANKAALLITEDFPAPPFPQWINRIAATIDTPIWAIDTSCIFPMQKVGQYYNRAYLFRSAVQEEMLDRVQLEWPTIDESISLYDNSLDFKDIDFSLESINDLCARCHIDHSVAPVHHTPGGSVAGYQRWSLFKEHGLNTYHAKRNNAVVNFPSGVSRLSPYLHHGHVSPFRIAREAFFANSEGSKKYLDELLIWRELAFNLCFHHENVDSIDILPSWARQSLLAHTSDPRPALYSLETLERGETDDALWNAAQKSLLFHGELHNNVRMTWGKAILQWTKTPQQALDVMIRLNHRYALDGSDPNSYGGLLWCLGLFDRPFPPEKPIYGTIRTRPTEHQVRRLNLQAYTAKVHRSPRSTPLNVAIIGAGMAGLSAAQSLQNNGLQVKLFDKSRGPGGRMATRRVDQFAFDHGAQYFTVRDARFRRQVNSWIEDGIVDTWAGTIGTADRGTLEKKEASPARFVGTPRMSAITRHMATNLDIAYKTRIEQAVYDDKKWTLFDTNRNNLGDYDALIVTTPPEQAIPFLQTSPTLESKVRKINMLPCWAVMAAFEEPLPIPFDGLFLQNNPLSWACRNSSKPGRPQYESWILHGSPEWSKAHLERDATEVLPQLLAAFAEATGIKLKRPIFSTAHRWRYALAETPSDNEHLWDEEKNLVVSGDWCNGSRVEGAYLSGVAAAGRVAGLPDTLPTMNLDVQLSIPGL